MTAQKNILNLSLGDEELIEFFSRREDVLIRIKHIVELTEKKFTCSKCGEFGRAGGYDPVEMTEDKWVCRPCYEGMMDD